MLNRHILICAVQLKNVTCIHCKMYTYTQLFTTSTLFHSIHCSWYWGDIPRAEAEKWLLTNNNRSGTFLVRTSSSQKDSLSLSIRDGENVKHYRIRRFDSGLFYIAPRISFQTLQVSVHTLQVSIYTLLYRCTVSTVLLYFFTNQKYN